MKLIKLLTICLLCNIALASNAQTKKKPQVKKTTSTKKASVKKSATPAKSTAKQNANPAAQNKPANTSTSNSATSNTNSTNASLKKATHEFGLGKGKHIVKGTKLLSAGIGFSNYGLPLHVSIEKLVANDISVGVFANGQSYNALGNFYNDSHLILHAGAKGNYFFNHILGVTENEWLLAAGLSAGYWRYFYEGNASNLSWGKKGSIYLASQVDLRYFFNKHWGILLQGNYGGMNAGIIGVTYKP
jgi:outer membrane immunogenic protein